MTMNRRKFVTLSAAGLIGIASGAQAKILDGVGPNRGIVSRGKRSKHTCDNSAVPISDVVERLSLPEDFRGQNCALLTDSHEGPFFTCAPAPGKNIIMGQAGQKLTVAFRLIDGACQPIPNGTVDIWACNADGAYSGYSYNPDKFPPLARALLFGHIEPDLEPRFCRGALKTDADGIAEFDTIYPGFYYGQPIHIHFKVHVNGKHMVTSQANISEAWNERVMQLEPYNKERPIKRSTAASGFPEMRIIERGERLMAVLDLVVPT